MGICNGVSIAWTLLPAYYNLKIMELTLNLVWVCVAIVAVLAQIVTLSNNGASLRRPSIRGRKVIAMGCALVILFFVISMTDDLHDQEVLTEERKVSQMVAGADAPGTAASARSIPVDFLLFFPPEAFSPALPAVGRLLESPESPFAPAIEGETLRGRAPPLSLA